jgi:hypothetical protein
MRTLNKCNEFAKSNQVQQSNINVGYQNVITVSESKRTYRCPQKDARH